MAKAKKSNRIEPERVGPKETFGVRVSPDLKKEIGRAAKKMDRPASWLAERALKKGWEVMKSEDKELAA